MKNVRTIITVVVLGLSRVSLADDTGAQKNRVTVSAQRRETKKHIEDSPKRRGFFDVFTEELARLSGLSGSEREREVRRIFRRKRK